MRPGFPRGGGPAMPGGPPERPIVTVRIGAGPGRPARHRSAPREDEDMKRMLLVVAVAAGWAAAPGAARADWGGYSTSGPAAATVLPQPGQFSGPGTLLGAGAGTPG